MAKKKKIQICIQLTDAEMQEIEQKMAFNYPASKSKIIKELLKKFLDEVKDA